MALTNNIQDKFSGHPIEYDPEYLSLIHAFERKMKNSFRDRTREFAKQKSMAAGDWDFLRAKRQDLAKNRLTERLVRMLD